MKPCGARLLFVWSFTDSVSVLVTGLIIFSIFSASNLGNCTFLRIYPFLGKRVVHFIGIQFLVVISYGPLYFCGVNCNFSFIIYNFIDLDPVFSLMNLAKGISILLTF